MSETESGSETTAEPQTIGGSDAEGVAEAGSGRVLYHFEGFVWDPLAKQLFHGEDEVLLSPRIVRLLDYLIERPRVALSRDQLIDELWKGVLVSDHSLTESVSRLRHSLGDDLKNPRFIQTIPAHGFRWVAPVRRVQCAADGTVSPAVAWPPIWKLAVPGAVLSGALVAIMLGAIFLDALPFAGPGPTMSQIMLPDGTPAVDVGPEISPDGRFLAVARGEPSRLAVLDLEADTETIVTEWSRVWNGRSIRWSPDGRMLAVGHRPLGGGDTHADLYDLETGASQRLFTVPDAFLSVAGFYPDGTRVLIFANPAGPDNARFVIVGLDGAVIGQIEVREGAAVDEPYAPRLSPDGRWLAYERTADWNSDLWLADAEALARLAGEEAPTQADVLPEVALTRLDSDDRTPIWAADSGSIFFGSDRGGLGIYGREYGVWRLDIVDGGASIEGPTSVAVPTPVTRLLGASLVAPIVFYKLTSSSDLHVVELDPVAGDLTGPPLLVEHWRGWSARGSWSDDPDLVMYQSGVKGDQAIHIAAASSEASTADRVTLDVEGRFTRPLWSPDGSLVYYVGEIAAGSYSLFEQEVATGTRRRLSDVIRAPASGMGPAMDARGRWMLFNVYAADEDQDPTLYLDPGLYLFDLDTGDLERVPGSEGLRQPALSPDGEWIATTGMDNKTVQLLSRDGSIHRVIATPDWWVQPTFDFSPDSQQVAYIVGREVSGGICNDWELWLVDRDGGEPRKVESADELNPIYLDWSHRTNRIALTTNKCEEGVWVYDGL